MGRPWACTQACPVVTRTTGPDRAQARLERRNVSSTHTNPEPDPLLPWSAYGRSECNFHMYVNDQQPGKAGQRRDRWARFSLVSSLDSKAWTIPWME